MQKATYEDMKRRFEHLKKMYFKSSPKLYDEDGQELPTAIDRSIIVKMFENMGVELPLSPNDEMKFVGHR